MVINLPPFSTWTTRVPLFHTSPHSPAASEQQLVFYAAEFVHHLTGRAHSASLLGWQEQHRQEFPASGTCRRVLWLYVTCIVCLNTFRFNCSRKMGLSALYRGHISWGRVIDKRHRQNSFLSVSLLILQTREKLQNKALKPVCLFRLRQNPKQLYALFYLKTDWSFLHHKLANSRNPFWSEADEQASS